MADTEKKRVIRSKDERKAEIDKKINNSQYLTTIITCNKMIKNQINTG